jgi:hypothetical protein
VIKPGGVGSFLPALPGALALIHDLHAFLRANATGLRALFLTVVDADIDVATDSARLWREKNREKTNDHCGQENQ